MAFAHLHVHTEYSALDGMIRANEAFDVVKAHGQSAMAFTDHGTLGGMWAGQAAADRAGVKFIAGCEFYLANGSRHDKHPFWVPRGDASADEDSERSEGGALLDDIESGLKARAYQHLTILARNAEGWRNLVILNNKAELTKWRKPRIDWDLIAQHSEGLIILTGCLGGPVIGPMAHAPQFEALASTSMERAAEYPVGSAEHDAALAAAERFLTLTAESREAAGNSVRKAIEAVGAENVYVEIMDHGIEEESRVIPDVVALAREHGVGIVATNDAHHTHEHQQDSHAAWLLVQSKSTVDNPKYQFHGSGYYLRSEEEMRAVRPESWWQEACDNTQVIADRCDDRVVPGHRDLLPRFATPDGFASNRDYIYSLLRDGAARIYGGITPEVRARVLTEMEVIEESGYVDYFLIVHDLIAWCRDNGILTGPGRGSAAGSLVSYLLGITRVDPLRYGLLFERFLERGRTEPPDIDIDFPQQRRDDVIQYLRQRWGTENVAFIGTFGMARSKAALKDAARVLGLVPMGNKMAALLPDYEAKPLPLRETFNAAHPIAGGASDYRSLVEKDADAARIHRLASSFEDIIKGVGLHASGVIVSAVPLTDLVPMRMTERGWALQWTGPEAESFGLLKVDVLGLRNLDIIAKAVELIAETTGEVIDPVAIPDPDEPAEADRARVNQAWRVIAEGRTAGLFQLESPKMTELATDVAPTSLDDLAALVALYRPGPMGEGLHTEFANRKRNAELVSYRDYTTDSGEEEALSEVLGDTFGLMVYQEQVMRLGTTVAGFDAGMRSKLRKAVSKKKKDLMEFVGSQFAAGAPQEFRDETGKLISIPFSPTTVATLWSSMLSFASYAFNKSHAATYGYLSYVTAFLKGNWPTEYAAATLAVTDDNGKRLRILRDLGREGVRVLAPDVNAGNAYTAPAGDHVIRIGLAEIRSVGEAGEHIAAARARTNKPFSSLSDLVARVPKPDGSGRAVTTSHLRALIESGAMDAFGPRLGQLATMYASHDEQVRPVPVEWGVLERAARQRQALLLPVGEHPLLQLQDQVASYQPQVAAYGYRQTVRPVPVSRVPDEDRAFCRVIGVLAQWTERSYSGGRMASIFIEGSHAAIAGTMWDDSLRAHEQEGLIPQVGQVVCVSAKVRYRLISADPDSADGEDQVIKELTIMGIESVPIQDDIVGEWPRSQYPRIDFTAPPTDDGGREADVEAQPVYPEPASDVKDEINQLDIALQPPSQSQAPASLSAEDDPFSDIFMPASEAEPISEQRVTAQSGVVTPIAAARSFAGNVAAHEGHGEDADDGTISHGIWSASPAGETGAQLLISGTDAGKVIDSLVDQEELALTYKLAKTGLSKVVRGAVKDGTIYLLRRAGEPVCLFRVTGTESIRAATIDAREEYARQMAANIS